MTRESVIKAVMVTLVVLFTETVLGFAGLIVTAGNASCA
jgi:hypothetical protein